MYRHNFRIAASILLCFLIQIQGADKYTDENRPYEFGFEVQVEGMKQQHRHEEKDKDGIIKGEFGFITADDVYHVTVYATDKDGHFKILSMKNIHLKSSTASAGSISSSPRQGHALTLAASTKPPVAPVTASPVPIPGAPLTPKITPRIQPISTLINNAPPQKNAAAQTSFTPVPEPSPIRACSGCSVPTSPKPPPIAIQVNNFNQNQQTLLSPAPPSLNNLQSNGISQPIISKSELTSSLNLEPAVFTQTQNSQQQRIEPSYSPILSNEQVYRQSPSQPANPVEELSNNQQAMQKANEQEQVSNPKPIQKTNGQEEVSNPGSIQNYPNQPSQSVYPREEPPVSNSALPILQQPSQSLHPLQKSSVSNNAEPISQQPIQPSYPQQASLISNNVGPTSQQPSQSSFPQQVSSITNNAGLRPQQPSQSSYPQVPSIPNKAGLQSQQPDQTPLKGHLVQSNPQQVSLSPYPVPGRLTSTAFKPNSNLQGATGEREPKQYNGPQQSQGLGQAGQIKPQLVSVDMQIVDKNTDIHALQLGEKEGLPAGLSEHDMSRLLYTFNYTVGFHGHFEEGYENGDKRGYYYVTGRNGVKTRIDYVADGTGFHPKISQEVLDLLSDDVPKPETEKDAKYGLKNYEFKWLYYPIGS